MNESQLNAYGICTPVSIGIESNRSLVLLEKRLAVLIKVVMYECEFLGGGKGLNGGGGGIVDVLSLMCVLLLVSSTIREDHPSRPRLHLYLMKTFFLCG